MEKYCFVFYVTHQYVSMVGFDGSDIHEIKEIGVYSSHHLANLAIQRFSQLPGFSLYPNNFIISKVQCYYNPELFTPHSATPQKYKSHSHERIKSFESCGFGIMCMRSYEKRAHEPLGAESGIKSVVKVQRLYSQGLNVLKRLAKFLLEWTTAVELEPKIAPGADNARRDLEQH